LIKAFRTRRAFGSLSLCLRRKNQTAQTNRAAYDRVARRPEAVSYLRSRKTSGFESLKLFVLFGCPEGCGHLTQGSGRDVATAS
jgi:hypothetical protein